jgi:aldehyde dehydrogenase (NAD+)
MTRTLLELGGKSAMLVLDDAALAAVLPTAGLGACKHAGQGCALLTRILVHQSLHDELVARITAVLGFISVGDPSDPTTMMGPLIREAQRRRVESLIATGVDEGAQIAFGGKRPAQCERGYFVEPTLFVGVDNSMRIAQDEFFGPVGVVIPFSDDDEAVRLANDSRYGLAGGVWSADPLRAVAVGRRLRAGTVIINGGGGGLNPSAPFGGYKHSGIGREFGEHGLAEYLQHKALQWPVG